MSHCISRNDFIDVLKDGVKRTTDFLANLTEYHGGPANTEYLLTSDIARAMLSKYPNVSVKVECMRQDFLNMFTISSGAKPERRFGTTRADIGVFDTPLMPRAVVEVKLGVGGTLRKVIPDLKRNCNILNSMEASIASKMHAAAVFEVHVGGRSGDIEIHRLKKKIAKIEAKLTAELARFAGNQPNFSFDFVPLQGANQGYTPTEIEDEETDHPSLGREGHATRYYAIVINDLRQKKPNETTRDRLRNRISDKTSKAT